MYAIMMMGIWNALRDVPDLELSSEYQLNQGVWIEERQVIPFVHSGLIGDSVSDEAKKYISDYSRF